MNPQKKYKVVVFTSMNTKSLPDACHGVVRFTETHPEWDVTFSPGRSAKLLKQDAASADGVLVTRWPPETPRNILGPGKPMVFIDPDSHLKAAANLCEHMIDNTRIGTVAAQHLLSLRRYKSFAFATLDCRKSDKEPIFIRERHESFSAALRNKGVACTTIAPGQEAHILSALSKPVAVFAVTDERAAEFVREAHKLGLSIPRDLAILGVDNNTFQCESTTPSISSIDVDFTGSAIMACQKLDDLMHGKPVQSPSVYSGDIRLVARKSTAAPGPSGRLVTRALELVRARSKNGLRSRRWRIRLAFRGNSSFCASARPPARHCTRSLPNTVLTTRAHFCDKPQNPSRTSSTSADSKAARISWPPSDANSARPHHPIVRISNRTAKSRRTPPRTVLSMRVKRS